MLASSNLSVITPKSNANSSHAGGESSASADSFDSVFQQVSGELSAGPSSQSLPPSGDAIKDDVIEAEAEALVASDESPLDEGLKPAFGSVPNEVGASAALVEIDQDNISNLTAESAPVQGVEAELSQDVVANTALTSTQPNLILGEEGDLSATDISEKLDSKLLDTSHISAEMTASAPLNSVNSVEKVSVEQGVVKGVAVEEVGEKQQKVPNTLTSQGEELNPGGNSLQSQGVKVANQGEPQLSSVSENELVNNQDSDLNDNSLAPRSLATVTGVAISDTAPIESSQASVEELVESNSKVVEDSSSKFVVGSLGSAVAAADLTSSSKVATSNGESSDLLNEQLESFVKGDANKVAQSPVPEGNSIDVSAGLALLGAGALPRDTKSQVVSEKIKLASSSPDLVSPELAENADLDWIMQQMPGEQNAAAELGIGAEPAKLQMPVTSGLAQNTDQITKVAAPLSLGLVAGESGLLEAGPEPEILVETEVKNNGVNKVESELGRQLDTSSSMRSGLGDSSLGTNVVNAAPSSATEAKFGLAAAATNTTNPTNMTMQVPPNHPNWSSEMGEKMMWMNRQGIQQAEIHLDPPELGSLTVKVSVDSDVATVSFVAASTQVKDLLEGQVQRLREMMAQQGVELAEVDVNVSQQGSGSQQSEDEANNQFAQHDLDADTEEVDSSLMLNEANVSRSKVDFYA